MFINSSKTGTAAYIIGKNAAEELLIVTDLINWDNKKRLASLLNASEIAGIPITLNDGREFFFIFDAKMQQPQELIILKYETKDDQKFLVDIGEQDKVILGIALQEFMKIDDSKPLRLCIPAINIDQTLNNKGFINAYESMNERAHNEFFRGGAKDAANICASFRYILNNTDYKYLLDLYIFICCRASMGMSMSRTEQSFNISYKDIEPANRYRLITFVNMHREELSLSCTNDISLRVIDTEIDRIKQHAESLKELSKPENDNFGLNADNPILTMSIPKAYTYIDRLIPDSGCVIRTERIGVAESSFPDIVDKYELEIADGDEKRIVNIFIDSYAESDTASAPKGFHLREASFEDALKAFAHSKVAFDDLHPQDNEIS